MKQFSFFRYLRKYQAVIAANSILIGILFYIGARYYVQTYTAATVIEYTNDAATVGFAPDGSAIDTSEIYASNIIAKVIQNLGMDSDKANMDALRSGISVKPIFTEEEQMAFEAKLEAGEDAKLISNRYMVTFTSGVSSGKEYPRKVLNEILDEYMAYYGKTHVNSASGTNGINDIYSKGYDYIEMTEVIDQSLEATLVFLDNKINEDDSFRAYCTGYSFSDLYREFDLLRKVEVPRLSADILHRKITKGRDVLLAKYYNRNNDLTIENNASLTEIEKIEGIINSYVDMMSNSDNTNITYEYILQDVYDNYGTDENGMIISGSDKTTEYDSLLYGYVRNRTGYENNLIDIAYNQYVQDVYATADAKSSDQVLNETQNSIQELVQRVNELYLILGQTNDEYNEYLGAVNISVRSSVGVTEKIPVERFTVLVVIVFGILGCLGAILVGRLGDIIDYYAYTNKVDGLPNRAKCDQYISAMEKQMLPGDFVCMVLKMTNLREENVRLGRDTGDKMMKTFAQTLTRVFIPSDKVFVGYNGSGQYLIFAEGYYERTAEAALRQIHTVVNQQCEDLPYHIEFHGGFACAETEQCFTIRKLLSLAIEQSNQAAASVRKEERSTVPENNRIEERSAAPESVRKDERSEAPKIVRIEERSAAPESSRKTADKEEQRSSLRTDFSEAKRQTASADMMFDENEDYYKKFISMKKETNKKKQKKAERIR